MKWMATAVWGFSDMTIDQVFDAADDLDGDAGYDPATGFLSLHFELIATTRDEAVAIARDLAAAMSLPQPVVSITVQPYRPRPPIADGRHHVDALTFEMNGIGL
jgi:hypothetical protein